VGVSVGFVDDGQSIHGRRDGGARISVDVAVVDVGVADVAGIDVAGLDIGSRLKLNSGGMSLGVGLRKAS